MKKEGDVYTVKGKQLKKIFDSTNFNDFGSLRYLISFSIKMLLYSREV